MIRQHFETGLRQVRCQQVSVNRGRLGQPPASDPRDPWAS